MNVTNEWGANYYVLVGTKQLNSINAFTTASYSNGGNVVFWIALNSQKQWGLTASAATGTQTLPISFSTTNYAIVVSQSDWDSNAEKYCARVKTRNKSSFSWFWGSVFQSGNGRLCFIVAGHQKQWGEATLNSAKTLPISFSQAAYCAVGTPQGAANTDNTTYYKIDVNSVYFSNYGYNGKCYFIVVGL